MSKKGFMGFVEKHTPEILTGIGIVGMMTTTVMAVRATPKALLLIENKMEELEVEKLPAVDLVKTTWKCYIPAVVIGTMSTICLVGASSVNVRRNAAIAAAYAISENALKEYQEKVIEEIGEKKEKTVRDAVAKGQVEKAQTNLSTKEVIFTDAGNTLCLDSISGRFFKADVHALKKAENELNRQMRDDMYISLNEFYNAIGLSGIDIGYDLGWNIDRGYIELEFSSQIVTEEPYRDTPCLVINYKVVPRYDYR